MLLQHNTRLATEKHNLIAGEINRMRRMSYQPEPPKMNLSGLVPPILTTSVPPSTVTVSVIIAALISAIATAAIRTIQLIECGACMMYSSYLRCASIDSKARNLHIHFPPAREVSPAWLKKPTLDLLERL